MSSVRFLGEAARVSTKWVTLGRQRLLPRMDLPRHQLGNGYSSLLPDIRRT
jgi:hypothetical protein